MLFHFQLRSLADVTPWGSPGKLNLHWFGLTDGWYWLQVNEHNEIFRFSSELLTYWREQYPPESIASPYVDYYVVRLWEDILQMLPAILEPLPPQLAHMLATEEQVNQWRQRDEQWEQRRERRMQEDDEADYDEEEEDEFWETYTQATRWWSNRMLNAGYLQHSPQLWFWNDGDSIHCFWDNSQQYLKGLPVWEAQRGLIRLTLSQFLEEVDSFHARLMQAMKERIQEAKRSWPRPEIALDIAALEKEQQDRSQWLALWREPAGSRKATPWNEVFEAMKKMDRFSHNVK